MAKENLFSQTEPKRPLMPQELLVAAIDGDETNLKQLLGLNNGEQDHPPQTTVYIESSDCLIRSAAGMENTILHILSANGHGNLVSTICMKNSSLLKARNVRNETPFHHAARFGHINTILELIRCAKLTFGEDGLKELLRQTNCLGETALHEAARHGHGDVVSTLMEEDLELAGLVNDDSVSPLYLATARGSLDMVKNMVEKLFGHEITPAFYSGPKQQTALHTAVLQYPELTEELLKLYSEPLGKGADETGRNPFHLVASTGNHEIAKLLLDKDPSLAYIQNSEGSFPVHTAAQMGHVKMIVLLLKRFLDSGDLLDGSGRNFLHIAIEAKKSDVLFKLLKDSKNNLPIPYWEIMFNRMANTMDNKGDTPLHLAAKHGYVTVMHSLLKNNALDLTLQNKEGQTAFNLSVTGQPSERRPMPHQLLKAAMGGNETDLKELLGLNDDEEDHLDHMKLSVENVTPMLPSDCLRSITGMGDTIVHILSANGHNNINLVDTICTKDSSLLKAHNVRKETPFHHAARFGHADTILKLIQCAQSAFGEDGLTELLRKKNCLGETALHKAARHGHQAVVSTLMEEDPELAGLVNDDYVSPLYLATARGSLDMVKNMVQKMLNHEITPDFYSGPKMQTVLHAAVLQDTELTKELLQLYSEPVDKWADERGKNPFHLVASTGNHEIAKLLLDKDPSMAYIQDSDGSFPVHTAARMGHDKMIVLLLQRCPDSGELLDGNGRNFLHVAIEERMFISGLLKDSKKELPITYWNKMLNTTDNKGNTPLHLAAEHDKYYIMHSLLKNNELDLTIQNKQSLTAFDLSVIQYRKYESNTQRRHYVSELYVKKRGARLSTGWFQHYTKDQMSETELITGTNEDHISTMDAGGTKMNSPESLMAKAQLVGLGSVLIATVTFAAAFTLPGGTNQETGTPILGKNKFKFQAFILADFMAFFMSSLATMLLIYSSRVHNSNIMEYYINLSMNYFTLAAQCMVTALGLGLYLVLAPIGRIGAAVLCGSLLLILLSNVLIVLLPYMDVKVQLKILALIPDVTFKDIIHLEMRRIRNNPLTNPIFWVISNLTSMLILILWSDYVFSKNEHVKK